MRRRSPGRARGTAAFVFLAAAGVPAAAQDVVPGAVTERIVSPTDTTQQYALYLPTGYGRAPAPVLFVLDPRGRAVDALELFRAAAERHGWIVLSSWNSLSDGAAEPNVRAMNAMLGDARASFEIAGDRLYIAGFSGTARIAWDFARQLDGAVAGIFGASAGTDPVAVLLDTPLARVAFFGTAGVLDFNHDEMRRFERRLEAWGLPKRMRIFNGGHQWPPEELAAEAIAWFELVAMRNGSMPVDSVRVQHWYSADSARLDAADLPERHARAREMAADYAGLRDTSTVSAIARTLGDDARVVAARARERALLEQSAERERGIVAWMDSVRSSERMPTVPELLAGLAVPELVEEMRSRDTLRAQSAQRSLEQVFAGAAFYLPRELIESGSPERALRVLEVAETIHPGQAQVLLQRARALSALDRLEDARSALDAAIEAGIPLDVVRADTLLARIPRSARARAERVEFRSVRLDDAGVIRWTDTGEEVALFGANYTLPRASPRTPGKTAWARTPPRSPHR